MTGSPRKRVKQTEVAREKADLEERQRQFRVRNGVPLPGDVKATGKPFTPETAKDAAAKATEARKEKREKPAAEPVATTTAADRKNALATLRKNMKSPDEKVAHAAAVKVLEYELGRPQPKNEQPERIVFESAYIDPELASGD